MRKNIGTYRSAITVIPQIEKGLSIVFLLGILTPIAIGTYYGGSPAGQVNGKYYLSENRKKTQVSKEVYELVQSTSLLLVIAGSSLISAHILSSWRKKHLAQGSTKAKDPSNIETNT